MSSHPSIEDLILIKSIRISVSVMNLFSGNEHPASRHWAHVVPAEGLNDRAVMTGLMSYLPGSGSIIIDAIWLAGMRTQYLQINCIGPSHGSLHWALLWYLARLIRGSCRVAPSALE